MNSDYDRRYAEYLSAFEEALAETIQNGKARGGNEKLLEAMTYSLTAGGKRVRPVLLLAASDLFGGDRARALPFAVALEMIHTYSLIHDDLPAMDNDDFRRGRPSCHKMFGEDCAILAGDALLNGAFEIAISRISDEESRKAAALLADCAGCFGMIGGQAYDLAADAAGKESDLLRIQALKTGKLLTAPLLMGSALACGGYERELSAFGDALGKLFQTTDDILDVISTKERAGKSVGKDAEQNKLTAVSIWGLEGAKRAAERFFADCESAAMPLGSRAEFLVGFARRMLDRISL